MHIPHARLSVKASVADCIQGALKRYDLHTDTQPVCHGSNQCKRVCRQAQDFALTVHALVDAIADCLGSILHLVQNTLALNSCRRKQTKLAGAARYTGGTQDSSRGTKAFDQRWWGFMSIEKHFETRWVSLRSSYLIERAEDAAGLFVSCCQMHQIRPLPAWHHATQDACAPQRAPKHMIWTVKTYKTHTSS